MENSENWLMSPVLAGLCKYESLLDGTLDLFDIARMNDALLVKSENDYRATEAARKNNGGK